MDKKTFAENISDTQVNIILDMLKRNMEIKMIMQATGLSEYEIKKIKYSI